MTDRAEFLAQRIAAARERESAGATTPAVRALAPRALLPRIIAAAELERVQFKGYCGVFRQGTRYAKGDAITHSGSVWLATRDPQPEDKPGSSDASKLVVRKGEQGPPGEAGPIGPMPRHQWQSDGEKRELRFQQPTADGDVAWGEWVDLRGPQGERGQTGIVRVGGGSSASAAPPAIVNGYFPQGW